MLRFAFVYCLVFDFAYSHTPQGTYLEKLQTQVKRLENDSIEIRFVFPSADVISNTDLDQNMDSKLNQTEFKSGYIKIDKWLRKEFVASGSRSGNLCIIKQVQLEPMVTIYLDPVIQVNMFLDCPEKEDIVLDRGFVGNFSRPVFSVVRSLGATEMDDLYWSNFDDSREIIIYRR